MAKQNGKGRSKKSTANSAKRLDKRTLNPGHPSTLKPFVKGDPRINLSGRPKLIGEANRKVLASAFPSEMISAEFKKIVANYTGDPEAAITYAERIAISQAMKAASGDTNAAREMRAATEGDRIRTWRDDVIDLLREGKVTTDALTEELGNELAQELITASGIRRDEGGKVNTENAASSDTHG